MGISATIAAVGNAIAKAFGFAKQRDAENNTPAMTQAANQVEEQKAKDQENSAIANKDTKTIQDDLAE